ncbi:MAG: ATP-binding protein [Planctomycetes bacterium]|nr:ATP-binding protein [Planctomycetota bacterium]
MSRSRMRSLQTYSADHRFLVEQVSQAAGLVDPVVVDLDEFYEPVLRHAKKKALIPIDGVLVRDWDPDNRRIYPGIQLGSRLYDLDGIRFARVRFAYDNHQNGWGFDFIVVERKNYSRLYKVALTSRRDSEPPSQAPVMKKDQMDLLWQNTIGYLDRSNLRRIKEYGGRAKRGVLLMGPPGNGKTSACRYIWQECRRRRWEWRLVTPDSYRQARSSDSIEELFSVDRRGIVFFDDMDIALRDRDTVHETEDQAVFLSALDGISVNEGVVFVFTTNCSLDLIDRAFKRPGRIDLVLHFDAPTAELRRELLERWHPDIRNALDINKAVSSTDGLSFAEVEELKNLLIMHFMDKNEWNWDWAIRQLDINRHDLASTNKRKRHVGFGAIDAHSKEEIPFNGH